jgi:sugar O-acyltransferase (sialic acid O-acetyltransferase NeuD family)
MKRFFDFSLSFIGLILLSPLLILIGIMLFASKCRPILFTQNRVGKNGAVFKIYKFRTMRDPLEGEDPHSMARLTTLGKILRGLSLDELPGLLNVLKGEMSLVGPRPLLVDYLARYSERQNRRHHVLPGITGWAQVNGRNSLSWEDKFNYDLFYVENQNFLFDIKILFKTFLIIFNSKSINSSKIETMQEFDPGLYIMGAGGHAKVIIATLQANDQKVMGVFDDDPAKKGHNILGVPVLGTLLDSKNYNVKKAVIGIGANHIRERVAKIYHLNWINVIHPDAIVHPSVKLGQGSVVFAKSVIQPDACIGDHVIINTAVIVEHDSHVGSFSHLCPGSKLAGNVMIEKGVLLGLGSNVIPGKRIGHYTVVGAGSTVIDDIKSDCVVVGSPAKIKRDNTQLFKGSMREN